MILFLQFLEFILFAFIAFYLPSKLLIEKIKINLTLLEKGVIHPIIGIFIFTVASLVARFLRLPFSSLYLFLIPLAIWSIKGVRFEHLRSFKIHFHYVILTIILLAGTISQSWSNYSSGIMTSEGIMFSSFHDPAFHLAVIGELKHHFPPEHPTFANVALKNYHFLPDFVIAGVDSMAYINKYDLYFRIIPFFVSLYFGLSAYIVAEQVTKKYWVKYLAVILVYFASSFSYFIPLFIRGASWGSGSFMLDQPFGLALNPQNVFGFIIFFIGIYFVLGYEKVNKISYLYVAGLIFASAFTFKAYVSFLGVSSLFVTSLYLWVIKKNFDGVRVFITSSVIFLTSYFLLINDTRNSIHLAPGWTLDRMVEDNGRLNIPYFALVKQVYFEKHNYLRIIEIYLKEFLIYFFGNLGTRFLGFFFLVLSLRSIKKMSIGLLFIFIFILGSLLIPAIFNQGGTSYNIIQFGTYALLITSILSAVAIEKIFETKLFKNKRYLCLPFIFVFVILSIPVTVKSFIGGFNPETFRVSKDQLKILNYLKNETNTDSVVLEFPDKNGGSPAYVSAISERRVFLADQVQVELTNLNYRQRYNRLISIINDADSQRIEQFLIENKISYLFLTADNYQKIAGTTFITKFKPIISNEGALLFRF